MKFILLIVKVFIVSSLINTQKILPRDFKHSMVLEFTTPDLNSSLFGPSVGYVFQHYQFLYVSANVGVGYPFLSIIFTGFTNINPEVFYSGTIGFGPALIYNIRLSFRFENAFYIVPVGNFGTDLMYTRLNSYMGGFTSAPWGSGSTFHFHWGIIHNTRGKNSGNFIAGFGYKFW